MNHLDKTLNKSKTNPFEIKGTSELAFSELFKEQELLQIPAIGFLKHQYLAANRFRESLEISEIVGTRPLQSLEISETVGTRLLQSLEIPEIVGTRLLQSLEIPETVGTRLLQSLEIPETVSRSLSLVTSNLPALKFSNSADQLESTTVKNECRQERLYEREVIRREIAYPLHSILTSVDVRLVKLWQGALEAFDSKNPDRPRHISISLRELFRHVLHYLAPDNSVRSWSDFSKHCDPNGPLTRKTRLLFICRDINHAPFSKFVEHYIAATLEFLNLFHRGTHEVESPFSEKQLSVLKHQMEALIRFLIEASRLGKS